MEQQQQQQLKAYTLGFFFDPEGKMVVLMSKVWPEGYTGTGRLEWQDGLLNGVGGLINEGEDVTAAMARKFETETGIVTEAVQWRPYGQISYPGGVVILLMAHATDINQFTPIKKTDEEPVVIHVDALKQFPVINNLHYLVPMALDERLGMAELMIDGQSTHHLRLVNILQAPEEPLEMHEEHIQATKDDLPASEEEPRTEGHGAPFDEPLPPATPEEENPEGRPTRMEQRTGEA